MQTSLELPSNSNGLRRQSSSRRTSHREMMQRRFKISIDTSTKWRKNEKLLAIDLSFEYYQESAKLCSRADSSLSFDHPFNVWGYLHKLHYIHLFLGRRRRREQSYTCPSSSRRNKIRFLVMSTIFIANLLAFFFPAVIRIHRYVCSFMSTHRP